MMKHGLVLCAVVLCVGLACEDDPVEQCLDCGGCFDCEDTRESVLAQIETAYNRRMISRYQEVLDENFVFFFFGGDVGSGVPAQWGRQEEISAHMHMFDAAYRDADPSDGVQQAINKISMDVQWEDGVQWQKITQDGGEEWFTATVFYNFDFQIGDEDHFVNNPGAKAEFTVRNAGTESEPRWTLVEMRDLGDNRPSAVAIASTDQGTWGAMKAKYR